MTEHDAGGVLVPGWRGFALPGLQAGRSPLLATLILTLLVTIWHAPLALLPQFGLPRSSC